MKEYTNTTKERTKEVILTRDTEKHTSLDTKGKSTARKKEREKKARMKVHPTRARRKGIRINIKVELLHQTRL